MARPTTHAAAWPHLAAPDRHPSKGSVALPLFPFDVHRPASTIQGRGATQAAASTI